MEPKKEQYLIAISKSTLANSAHWIMVLGKPRKVVEEVDSKKSIVHIKDTENRFLVILSWPSNFSWRMLVMLTIYISVVATFLMYINSSSVGVFITVQHACTIIFLTDFILAIIHRTKKLPLRIEICHRSYTFLTVEAVSLIPMAAIYLIQSGGNYDRDIVFYLSTNIFLRLYRLPEFFSSESRVAGTRHTSLTLLEYILYYLLAVLLFAILCLQLEPEGHDVNIIDIDGKEENYFFVLLYFSFMTYTNTGFGDISGNGDAERIICCIAMLMGFALTSGVLVGAITSDLFLREREREKYRKEFEVTTTVMKEWKTKKEIQISALRDLSSLWYYKRGTPDPLALNLLPIPLRKEITFDLNHQFLGRSVIFSVQETSFLRSVSLIMQSKTYLPGDSIVLSHESTRGMLCVASGIIELLSQENEDSPIISFASGTILGEASLFMWIPIKTIIRAATIVELQILEAKEFYRLALKYPHNYTSMKSEILNRFEKIKDNKSTEMDLGLQSTKCFINNLKHGNVLDVEPGSSNYALQTRILNLYVLTENIPQVNDAVQVFLKLMKQFSMKLYPIHLARYNPLILRPNTVFTDVWNKIIFFEVTLVAFLYPYLAAFVRTIDELTYLFLIITKIIYVSDIFLQCITAISRKDNVSYKITIKEIIWARLKSFGFYMDVFAAIDLSILSHFSGKEDHDYLTLLLSLNKLLKIWTIPVFFYQLEDTLMTNLLLLRIFKRIYYTLFIINAAAAVVYLEACPGSECIKERWFSYVQMKEIEDKTPTPITEYPFLVSLYVGLMCTVTAGFGNIAAHCMADVFTFTPILIAGLIVVNYCLAELSITYRHKDRTRTDFQKEIFAVDRFVTEHDLPQVLRERVRRYFEVQWEYDRGYYILGNIPMQDLPSKQTDILLSGRLESISEVPMFKNTHFDFKMVLARGCDIQVLPEGEMVVYAGCKDREMYILQSGYCIFTDKINPMKTFLMRPLTTFGELEMVQGIPMPISVRTLTHVKMIRIEYSTYMLAITKYPDVKKAIDSELEHMMNKYQTLGVVHKTTESDKPKSKNWAVRCWSSLRKSVINVYHYDRARKVNYYDAFRSWNKVSFLGYLMIPMSVKPTSALLRYWMVLRIAASLIIGLIAPVYFSLPEHTTHLRPIMMTVEVISLIDIYVTLHIGYYNEKGILIFHPAKTAIHYIKRHFFMDVFTVFPFHWIMNAIYHVEPYKPTWVNGIGLIHAFQIYRYLQACYHLENHILRKNMALKIIKFFPAVIILCNFLAALLILTECNTEPMEGVEITFPNNTMGLYLRTVFVYCRIINSTEGETSLLDMYIIALYWIVASTTTCGFGDITPHDNRTTIFCIATVLLGTMVYGCIFANIASGQISIHHILVKYRSQTKQMMAFMKKENVNPKMIERFYRHYEYNWARTLGHKPQMTLTHIHTALKQDIVRSMYEETLRKVSVLRNVDDAFIRFIGKYLDEIYFLMGETVVKYNHLQQDLYIIYTGQVDVIGPNGNLITTMGSGGLFGNISQKSHTLSTITAVASSKLELIRLRNEDFQKTLADYPSVRDKIASLTKRHHDFIMPLEGEESEETIELNISDFSLRTIALGDSTEVLNDGQYFLRGAIYIPPDAGKNDFIILPDNWLHATISLIFYMASIMSWILTTYMFAFQDFSLASLIFAYMTDLVFYIKIIIQTHLSYIDRQGYRLTNRKLIKQRYLYSALFVIDILANVPLDIFTLAMPKDMQYLVLSCLRLNRILRIYYVVDYQRNWMNRLFANVILLEVGVVFIIISTLFHFFSCIWYLAACPINFCYEESWLTALSMQNSAKFEIYITSIYFTITYTTTTGYGDIVAITRIELILITFMMMAGHFTMVLAASRFLSMMSTFTVNFSEYEHRILKLRRELKRQNISNFQLTNLWRYVQLLWWKESGKQVPKFITTAPYIMKCDVFSTMYGKHLSRSFIFTDLDNTFLRQLTIYMVRHVFFPGNYIIQQGDKDGTMYFINRGEVSVMTIHVNLMETTHYKLKDNDQFGLTQGLIFGQPHQFSYRAETEAEILSLTLSDWQHLFTYFPDIRPKIYERLEVIS